VGRRNLCVSSDGSATECAFSLDLPRGRGFWPGHLHPGCLSSLWRALPGGKKIKIKTNKRKPTGKIMTCQCPKPWQEQSTPASRALMVTQGGKARSPAAWGAWICPCGSEPGAWQQERDFRKTRELPGVLLPARSADLPLCPLGGTLLRHLSSKRHYLGPIYLWSLKCLFNFAENNNGLSGALQLCFI